MAMQFLSSWLNQYNKAKRFPIHCERLTGAQVHVGRDSRVTECLRLGGCGIARVHLDVWHYVLFTGGDDDAVLLFDPYFRVNRFRERGIEMVDTHPATHNRRVARAIINRNQKQHYALGPVEDRECVLMFNQRTRRAADDMEFVI
jgi:hypothetical protein